MLCSISSRTRGLLWGLCTSLVSHRVSVSSGCGKIVRPTERLCIVFAATEEECRRCNVNVTMSSEAFFTAELVQTVRCYLPATS